MEGALPEPGAPIHLDDQEVGEMRSGNGDRALALLRVDAARTGRPLTVGEARLVPEIPAWMQLQEAPTSG